ncbi:MAG: hypothetical protein ACRBI6_01925 [Acidimicrobiales bacterium]
MSLRREEMSSADSARQRDLDRSWVNACEALADDAARAGLEAAIARVNASNAAAISKRQFLEETEPQAGS